MDEKENRSNPENLNITTSSITRDEEEQEQNIPPSLPEQTPPPLDKRKITLFDIDEIEIDNRQHQLSTSDSEKTGAPALRASDNIPENSSPTTSSIDEIEIDSNLGETSTPRKKPTTSKIDNYDEIEIDSPEEVSSEKSRKNDRRRAETPEIYQHRRSDDIEADISIEKTESSPLIVNDTDDDDEESSTTISRICTTLFVTFFNFAMVIIGAYNIDKCEVLKLVPIFLIVAGSVGILLKPIAIFCQNYSRRGIACCMFIVSLLEFAWMVIVSYWVYLLKPDFDPASPSYCNKVAYYLAFWLLTAYWVVLGVGISFLCCACGLTCLINLRF